jgi:class 3 adenylate cyclase/predicted ATPase
MFCDLVGSTDLSGQLDPEELREVVRAYQVVCAEVIARFEGHIAQYLGDGLLVYFGYPLAHEDDAYRGVRSGLGIIEEMEGLNERLRDEKNVTLAVRIGIHTGLVVVGEMGGGEKRERLALGDTPNIAARLQGLAAPDAVVVSRSTHRLIKGRFDFQPLGAHSLKGIPRPMEVYQVGEEVDVYSGLEVAISGELTPLVGRDGEVQNLEACWERVKRNEGQVVLIMGGAGIGKSRLLQAFRENIETESYTWMICSGSPYYQNSAFYPIIELIQRRLRLTQEDSSKAKLHKLEAALTPLGFDLQETVPLIASFLSIPIVDEYPPLTMTPQKQKQIILEILVTWLLRLSQQQPLIFVMENLHWVDPSTLEHLALLMDRGAGASLLILLLFRPLIRKPQPTEAQLIEILLDRLSPKQVEEMVQKVTHGKSLPSEVLDQLLSKTDGVPLFVEELTKMILESKQLVEEDGRYRLAGPVSQLAIPSTLQDSLMARLDQLGSLKEVVQLGATLGREFSYELINAVSPLDGKILQEELAKLVKAELLHQQGTPPESHYSFEQALIQEAAYESLLKGTRKQYHQKIAHALEEQISETAETHPEILAHHYTVAGLKEKAVEYWLKAGQLATKRSANLEAINHLTRGLELVESLPESAERTGQELKLQVALGVPMTATKGFAAQEVETIYARARELCQRVGKAPQLFQVLRGLWLFYMVRADLGTALEIGQELLALGEKAEESALLLQGHLVVGLTLFYRGEFDPALEHLEQGTQIYNVKEHHKLAYIYGDDPGVVCLSYSSLTLWFLGYPDQAIHRDREALTLSSHISHPFSTAVSLNFSARLHQCLRQTRTALERAKKTVTLSTEQGFTHWLTTSKILQGWAMAELGEGEKSISMMTDGISAWKATGAQVFGLHCFALLAETYCKSGQTEEALATLEEAISLSQKNNERLYLPEVYRIKGEILLSRSETNMDEAEDCLRQSLSIARFQNAKILELRSTMSLYRLLEKKGLREEGQNMIKGIYDWFTEGFDTADLKKAKVLLEELV